MGGGTRSEESVPLNALLPEPEPYFFDPGLVRALGILNLCGAAAHLGGVLVTLFVSRNLALDLFVVRARSAYAILDGVNTTISAPYLDVCCPLYPKSLIVGFFGLSLAFHLLFGGVLLFWRQKKDEAERKSAGFAWRIADWYLECLSNCRAPWCAPARATAPAAAPVTPRV